MYKTFYTSSDIQLYITSRDHSKQIKLDSAISIAYNIFQTSNPIYSLGNRKAQFYSQGNTVANGILSLAFQDEEALKYAIDYVSGEENSLGSHTSGRLGHKKSNADFKESATVSFKIEDDKRLISIGAIQPLINIKLYINNESAIRGSDTKVLCFSDVKIVGEGMQSSSSQDGILSLVYRFNFKDIERG